jgi:carboxypeptidase family protein
MKGHRQSHQPLEHRLVVCAFAAFLAASAASQEGIAQRIGNSAIAGRVVDGSGAPIPGVLVEASLDLGRSRLAKVSSGDNGEFGFTDLPAGEYTLWMTKPGYLGGRYGQQLAGEGLRPQILTLKVGDRIAGLELRLWKSAVVAGSVADRRDRPVVGATVLALLETFASGHLRLSRAGSAKTDDRGAYRLSNLVPGTYRVAVLTWASERTTFFPMVDSVQAASTLTVRAGDEVAANIQQVPSPIDGVPFRGSLRGLGPSEVAQVQLFPSDQTGPITDVPSLVTSSGPDRRFAFLSVVPGPYLMRVVRSASAQPVLTEVAIQVDRTTENDLTVSIGEAWRISGRLSFDVASVSMPSPDRMRSASVWAVRVDGKDPDLVLGAAPRRNAVSADGSFLTEPLPSGKYLLSLGSTLTGWRIGAVFIGDRETPNEVVELGTQDVAGVSIAMTDKPIANVSGVVRDQSNVPSTMASVYVFPTDRRFWVDFGPAPQRLQLVRTDRNATYRVDLPNGDYFITARAVPIAVSWMGSPVLEHLVQGAEVVRVTAGSTIVRDLQLRR